ncbi:MAG: ATP-dependent helicase [Actinomycetota bacterium]|nr:ATP-dependent helicase [Actinomycetota bacterium]
MTVPVLDGEQRRAVETVCGPLAVYAGPGTGKTRVVTERIANAVARQVVPAASVVAVTFTDKAATELIVRLRRRGIPAGERGGVRAATFHSAALRQVAHFWPRVTGGVAPEVLPSKLPVLVPIIHRLGGPLVAIAAADLAAEVEWVKAQGAAVPTEANCGGGTEPRLPNHLATVFLDGPAPRWVLDREAYRAALRTHDGPWPRGGQPGLITDLFAELFDAYEVAKSAVGRIDFEDMLAVCATLVRTVEEVRVAVRSRYTHFTVDEFQDVNRLQWDLLTAWTGDHDDLCVVGDENQAIYGFAGASACYLAAFRARYPAATIVQLRRNYRSTQPVLDIAAATLPRMGPRKSLEAVRGDGPSPTLVECQTGQDERDLVIARCRTLNRSGVAWQEMAVLYRTNAQSEAWEEAFAAAGIPFVVRGGQPFFTRRHVTQALAVLAAAERKREGVEPMDDVRAALDGALPAPARLDRLVPSILRSRMSWSDAEPEGDLARERWSDLTVVVELARELYEARPDATLCDFLAELRRRAALGRAPDGGGVDLLTLHRAKGLEFDAIFVVSVEEGRIPSRLAVARDERLGLHVRDPRSAVAEENRLLYVGLTRARTHLHVSWVGGGGKRRSRFLSGVMSRWAPRSARAEATSSRTGRRPLEPRTPERRTSR